MSADRYTRRDAERAFGRLCEFTGHRVAASYKDVGGWRLDGNATYGGYVVEEIVNEGGAITHPLGEMRRPARDFCYSVNFAARVIESTNR
jgi:hypothetical protein